MSDGEAGLADTWSKITTNPALKDRPDLASTFMKEQVEPFVEKMQGLAKTRAGQEYALQTGDRLRQTLWRQTAGDQAAINGRVVQENADVVGNNATVSAARDPTPGNYSAQLKAVKDTADTFTAALHPAPGEASGALDWHQQYVESHSRDVVIAHYESMAESVAHDVSETGDVTKSETYAAAKKAYAEDLEGQNWVKGSEWVQLGKGLDDAVQKGQALYKSTQDTAKSDMITKGKADFAEIHSVLTQLALNGQGPTPDLMDTISKYAKIYGATNPGEVASLDDYVLKGQKRAQDNEVQPYNQQVREQIQGGMSLPSGDPRRPTLASLTKAWSAGQITKEDLSRYTEIVTKLDKPTEDPNFKPAWEGLTRWQNQMIQSIGQKGFPGTSAARAQFLQDTTKNFMDRGHGGGDWNKALDYVTNAQNPHSFANVMPFYQKAANRTDAVKWLQQHDQFYSNPNASPAMGSSAAPIYTAPAAPAQASKIQQKDVDSIIWSGH